MSTNYPSVWKGKVIDNNQSIKYSWQFDWKECDDDIDGFVGHIHVKRPALSATETVRFDVELSRRNQIIEKVIVNANTFYQPDVAFDYCLVPVHAFENEFSLEEMFLPSEKTDAVLVVDGKKLHVNKAFLSFHSDYFTALFSSNYKEGQMDEIPIKDVSFEDFGLLLSTIYPASVFPTDKTIEKLLELADRFLIPEVFCHAEHHLSRHSAIKHEKIVLLADKYKMEKLLKKVVGQIKNIEDGKKLKQSSEYEKLSEHAKAMILDELLH
ncbi:hypothetical protein CRE_14549 [Caenorhabditis remanei]|uniref:BTB domain-containing protein n=1 Tax=Caenorhabditis remanei TaxID=31234 RepID=E3M9H3_CAERE|nr:hypothetical protein CRE_14549 [Caenorhabditis remanei]